MKKSILFFAMLAAVAAAAHENHDHATGIVRDRMTTMEQMGKLTLSISQRLRANKDLSKIPADAKAIQEHSSKILSQFPAGSTQAPTAAKPEIWTAWPDFEAKAKQLETETQKLADLNPKAEITLREQFRVVTSTCTGCHETYRFTKQKQ